jgi:2-haloacid dehalogenase
VAEWHVSESMSSNRRRFVQAAVGCVAAHALVFSPLAFGAAPQTIKAVLFDAFPIFDPRPIFALVDELFSARGAELSELWRNRQFEDTWLRSWPDEFCATLIFCKSIRGRNT